MLANDTDIDSPTLHAILISGPNHAASFTLNVDGAFSYTPAANFNGADSFTYKANDGTADSNVATVNLTVNPVNDPPVLAHIESTALTFTEGDGPTPVTTTITVADVDSATLAGGSIAISAGYQNGVDVLAASPPATISASFNASTGVLTLSGTAPPSDYQAALRSVTFGNGSDNPSTTARTVSFTVNDGTSDSATVTRQITVTAVNNAPVNTVPGAQTVNEDTDLTFSTVLPFGAEPVLQAR